MPTGAVGTDFAEIARASGYELVYSVGDEASLMEVLKTAKSENKTTFIEIKVGLSSRADLGRPKESAVENKENFMKYHKVI